MLAVSLLIRLYGEISLAYLAAQQSGNLGFQLGRAAVPITFYLIQGLTLWYVAKGRNWARIVMIAFVLLNVVVAILVLNSPLGGLLTFPIIPLTQIVIETLAVVLLLFSNKFFSRRAVNI